MDLKTGKKFIVDIPKLKEIGADYDVRAVEITHLDGQNNPVKTIKVDIQVPEAQDLHVIAEHTDRIKV